MLVSVTITSNKQGIIAPAIRSVINWVDLVLVVHLRFPDDKPDRTLEMALSVAGSKLRVVEMSCASETGTGEMRNFGLAAAAALGGTWAVILDTDERILADGIDVKSSLEMLPLSTTIVSVPKVGWSYEKPRFFRLPVNGAFKHHVHEDWVEDGEDNFTYFSNIRFSELEKVETLAQSKARKEAALAGMRHQLEVEPNNTRWMYYLGAMLMQLNDTDGAVKAFHELLEVECNPATRAWVRYGLGVLYGSSGRHSEALAQCTQGMMDRPDFPELPWLAGLQCLALKRFQDAIYWEEIAILGSWCDTPRERVWFKDIDAMFEGPYEVLELAYKELGNTVQMYWARRKAMRARKQKELYKREQK